ncbi:MAG: saccharopine dehydrogenase [Kordiimonadales bacterium]|nr:MAG: saccharopine dehydrogenase [Kordiimonadales bacterium]
MAKAATNDWIIYGATGYTGRLITEMAVSRGLKPTLAGRNADKVKAIAAEFDLPWTAFSVDDPDAAAVALEGKKLLLSVAGPFSATADQMMNACIKAGAHYLDVTGEIDVFELAASKSKAAKKAGVTLLPGVGFDVVPSDCLAAHTAARSKNPVSLKLIINGLGNASRGTAKTGVESLGMGTAVRRGGKITSIKAGSNIQSFDFGNGAEEFIGVSWGDVSTAYHSTSIADIDVFFPNAGPIKTMIKMSRYLGPLMSMGFVKNFLKKQIDKMPPGPTEAERGKAGAVIRAEVTDESGAIFITHLETPNGYSLTADSAVSCAEKLLAGGIEHGFKTPSLAFGPSFINEVAGCKLTDH